MAFAKPVLDAILFYLRSTYKPWFTLTRILVRSTWHTYRTRHACQQSNSTIINRVLMTRQHRLYLCATINGCHLEQTV